MEVGEGVGGFPSKVAAGYLGFGVAPFDDDVTDGVCGQFGLTLRAANAQTGGTDTGVELGSIERLTRASPATLDDIDCPSH